MCSKRNQHKVARFLQRMTDVDVNVFIYVITSIFICSILSLPTAKGNTPVATTNDYFKEGLQEKEQGNYKKALAIWAEAQTDLSEPDFRISHSFIKLVTEEELEDHFTKASEIFFWGLEGTVNSYETDVLLKELDYLRPLISRRDYKQIENAIEEGDSEALRKLSRFWQSIDPTPLTDYNERLIEHWQRIDYAKEHLTKLNSNELDDRGQVYLKYGDPYYSKTGQLTYTPSFVTRILKEGIRTPSFGSSEQAAIASTRRMNIENRIRQYHQYSRYEVWIYRDLSEENRNTVYMFGTRDGTSSFRKIDSIEDFIPSEAYRSYSQDNYSFSSGSGSSSGSSQDTERDRETVQFDNIRSGGSSSQGSLTPALILQLMYYQQFAALDSYFGNAFDQMMDRFISVANTPSSTFKGLAREFGTLHGNTLIAIQSKAPGEKSSLYEALLEMPTEYYRYQFLNEDGEPYTKVFAQISFEEAGYYDLLKETNSLQTQTSGRYNLVSGFELRDESDSKLEHYKKETPVESFETVVDVFDIPQVNEAGKVLLSHELHRTDITELSRVSSSSPFPESLKGLRNDEIELGEPLQNEGLVLSDLIIGYRYADAEDDSESGEEGDVRVEDSLDFTIAHDTSIPEGSDLSFYYELYNIQPKGTDEISEYRFEYSINKRKKGLFGRRSEDALISIAITNTTIGETDKNVITIDTSNQEKGEYELNMLIRDLNSEATYSATKNFSIH